MVFSFGPLKIIRCPFGFRIWYTVCSTPSKWEWFCCFDVAVFCTCNSKFRFLRRPQKSDKIYYSQVSNNQASMLSDISAKQPKKYICLFLSLRRTLSQPYTYVNWVTSINSTDPRINPWNFRKKIWELVVLKNSIFFWVRPFWKFFCKKNSIASSPWKLIKYNWVSRMGFQPKTTHRKHFSPRVAHHLTQK